MGGEIQGKHRILLSSGVSLQLMRSATTDYDIKFHLPSLLFSVLSVVSSLVEHVCCSKLVHLNVPPHS
jgi:hypothetical protein